MCDSKITLCCDCAWIDGYEWTYSYFLSSEVCFDKAIYALLLAWFMLSISDWLFYTGLAFVSSSWSSKFIISVEL